MKLVQKYYYYACSKVLKRIQRIHYKIDTQSTTPNWKIKGVLQNINHSPKPDNI